MQPDNETPKKTTEEAQDMPAVTSPYTTSEELPDANVASDGHCLLTETAEQTRPDTGAPCEDGRDGL